MLPSRGARQTVFPQYIFRALRLCLCLLSGFSLSIVFVRHSASSSAPGQLAFRFMTYNIRYDNPRDGENRWEKRRAALVALIARTRPHVFGLQEALRHQLDYIQHELRTTHQLQYDWVGVGRDDGRDAGEFSPVFYLRGVVALPGGSGTFWLSDTPDQVGSRFPSAALPRVCTWAGCEAQGRRFYVFNTHFDHVGDDARTRSAHLVLRRISEIAALYPCVFAGDLNAERDSEMYRVLTSKYLRDARSDLDPGSTEAAELAGVRTFTDFIWPILNPANRRGLIDIDHVFLSGFKADSVRVLCDVREDDGRCISDHRPVVVDVHITV